MARVHHWQEDWVPYHLTTRTEGKAYYLAAAREKMTVIEAPRFYLRRGDFLLFGYVIMDNHIHLVIQTTPEHAVPKIMGNLKKWTSKLNTTKPRKAALWERRYDDNLVRDATEMLSIVKYIHRNPVRAGIVRRAEDYLWSSARNYAGWQDVMLPVTTEWY